MPTLPFAQGWGLAFRLILEDMPDMRRAGTADWGGLFDFNYWIDRAAGIAGTMHTQVLPVYDAEIVQVSEAFERGVYADIAPLHTA